MATLPLVLFIFVKKPGLAKILAYIVNERLHKIGTLEISVKKHCSVYLLKVNTCVTYKDLGQC